MSKRILKEMPILNNTANVLKIELYYTKGGMNYFTSSNEKRGLYLSVTPIERRSGSESFIAFSGIKKCVKEMPRFNQKQFDTFVVDKRDLDQLINHVVAKNNFELATEEKV